MDLRRALSWAALGFSLTLSGWLFLENAGTPDVAQAAREALPPPAPAAAPARPHPRAARPAAPIRQAGSIPSEDSWNTG